MSRPPVTLPTAPSDVPTVDGLATGRSDQLGEGRLAPLGAGPRLGGEDALVVLRHHLDEAPLDIDPVGEELRRGGRAGELDVPPDEAPDDLDVRRRVEGLEVDHAQVAAALEIAVHVEDVRDAPRHPR